MNHPWPNLRDWRITLPAVALLLVFVGLSVSSMKKKSVTTDEIMYFSTGYYHLETGRFDLNNTNPPLMKLVAGSALLPMGLDLPAVDGGQSDWSLPRQWQWSREFLYSNTRDADEILFRARLPIVAIGVLLGAYVFVWACRLYGVPAGLAALFLYALSPNMLAHARLATHDFGLAAWMFIFAYHFWDYVHRPRWIALTASGVALGAALLTKTAAVFLGPPLVLYGLWLCLACDGLPVDERLPLIGKIGASRPRSRRAASIGIALVLICVVAGLCLNIGYGFSGSFRPLASAETHEGVYKRLPLDNAATRIAVDLALSVPVPLPRPYVDVWKFQATKTSGSTIYLAGRTSRQGFWYQMLVQFLVKTPLPLLAIVGFVGFTMLRERRISDAELLAVATIGTLLALFTYLKAMNVGLRYVLPIYPFLHLLAARALRGGVPRAALRAIPVGLLAVWYLLGTVLIHPDYLAYFNESVGGPNNGYRVLVDSNLDWGQDMKALRAYMDRNGIERIPLAYFGSADAEYYGIRYDYLPSVGLTPNGEEDRWWFEVRTRDLPPFERPNGLMAISATLRAGVFLNGYYDTLRHLDPIDQVGHSILIYDFGEGAVEGRAPRAPSSAAGLH